MEHNLESIYWRKQWFVLYQYVSLHEMFPKQFPLPEKFWSGRKKEVDDKKRRLLPKICALGPYPKVSETQGLLGYGPGDTQQWIGRRFIYIMKCVKPLATNFKKVKRKKRVLP